MYEPNELWRFLPLGFAVTILIETIILGAMLSDRHGIRVRLFCGVGLTAVTYPIVIMVMPLLIAPYVVYLLVAEIFAPLAECVLFLSVFGHASDVQSNRRDCLAIVEANIASFLVGFVYFAVT